MPADRGKLCTVCRNGHETVADSRQRVVKPVFASTQQNTATPTFTLPINIYSAKQVTMYEDFYMTMEIKLNFYVTME